MATKLYEDELAQYQPDPDELPVRDRKLFTQPYDLSVHSLMREIDANTLHLRPRFQRQYIWPNRLASLLIESILLNIPIPPCYFAQNDDFELSVIDGQQRIYSIYRFLKNQFSLSGLAVLSELNGVRFHQLDRRSRRKIDTHTLRTVIITNDSHPEIQFDVFERLNTYTMPLNAQEIRNCIFRGTLNDLLSRLAEHKPWLNILRRKRPDKRLRDEELILRFFAFHIKGLDGYRTPQKHWLNEVAKQGKHYTTERLDELEQTWKDAIDKCLLLFPARDCFRRLDRTTKRQVVNRALMDLVMTTMAQTDRAVVRREAAAFRRHYRRLLQNEEFQDLIGRSIDHKSRTLRRFEMWREQLVERVF